jgi:uncharacterized C2H2 Zn-finger protein
MAKLKCPKCDRKFDSKKGLGRHTSIAHGIKPDGSPARRKSVGSKAGGSKSGGSKTGGGGVAIDGRTKLSTLLEVKSQVDQQLKWFKAAEIKEYKEYLKLKKKYE